MRQLQQMGAHLVISVWCLPERFYTDPYEKPPSAHFRIINPEKWDELLDLLGSYLLYARREYGVEPDLFSFNESNIGIIVGMTPESHTQAIKRIGAYFQKLGLKTKMLLGDATSPRDTYQFVLEAASDPDALPFIGAVGFHSWGGGTPEQYAAWGNVAEWLGLPLLVTEMGVDPSAYYTRSYDSYEYGLREARMAQELLTYARPQGVQYWEFSDDYALARVTSDGAVEPTARFWLMKHFTDLAPLLQRRSDGGLGPTRCPGHGVWRPSRLHRAHPEPRRRPRSGHRRLTRFGLAGRRNHRGNAVPGSPHRAHGSRHRTTASALTLPGKLAKPGRQTIWFVVTAQACRACVNCRVGVKRRILDQRNNTKFLW